jgi:hypothetical protein
VQGVRVIQRHFAIQNSCKRTTLTLIDFTIQILAKTSTLKMYLCAQRMALKLRAIPGRAQGALLGATPVNGSAHK